MPSIFWAVSAHFIATHLVVISNENTKVDKHVHLFREPITFNTKDKYFYFGNTFTFLMEDAVWQIII